MSSLATVTGDFRKAVHATTVSMLADDDITVAWSRVGRKYTDDMVVIGPARTEQEHAASNRGREITLTIDVEFHSYRRGDGDTADQAAFERMCAMAATVSEHLRSAADPGNATLGSVVRDCFEISFDSDSAELQAEGGKGRMWVGIAVYEAHARLRG